MNYISITFILFFKIKCENYKFYLSKYDYQINNENKTLYYLNTYSNDKYLISPSLYYNLIFNNENTKNNLEQKIFPFFEQKFFGTTTKKSFILYSISINSLEFYSIDNKNEEYNDILNNILYSEINQSYFKGIISLNRHSVNYEFFLKKLYGKKVLTDIENSFYFNFQNNLFQIGETSYIYNDIIKDDNNYITDCMLYELDSELYEKWTCKTNAFIYGENITNETKNIFNNKNKIYFDFNYDQIILNSDFINFFKEKIIKNFDIFCSVNKTYKNYFSKIICDKENNKEEYSFEIRKFTIVLNGYAYSFEQDELLNENKELNILFVHKNNDKNLILGKIFMKKLKGMIFDNENKKIYFVNDINNKPINVYEIYHDSIERFTTKFIIFSLVCVIILILSAILIPYYFYRRHKKKMLDRLNYDIIYKKVDNTKYNLLNSENEG